MVRRLALLLAALAGLCLAAPAAAELVRIDIVDRDSGRWLPVHRHRHEQWIAGTPGHRYAVRLSNLTGERLLAVLSVDGVNAVTGQTAHPAQTGYVLEPWQSAEIGGWRKSWQDVAQFVFTALPDSYAARTGRPDHVGTIGIAVFRERPQRAFPVPPRPLPPPPIAREAGQRAAQSEAPVAQAGAELAREAQSIGTGHGAREWAPTHQSGFQRASHRPAQILQLRYDAPGALAARGILRDIRAPQVPRGPQAFPGGFVPDPPAWHR